MALVIAVGASAPLATAHESNRLALADLSRRVAAHPDSVPLLLRRGELRRLDGDWAGARADFARVERLVPGLDELPLAKAALALDTGEPAAARALLDGASLVRRADPGALRLRARVLAELGEPRAAVADLDQVIARSAKPHPDLFLERARLQVSLGDRDGARAGLDEARARLGVTASLEPFAIELELEAQRPQAARERLEALRRLYENAEPLEGVAARIGAMSVTLATETRDGDEPPAARATTMASMAPPHRLESRSGPRRTGADATQALVTRGPYLQIGTPDAITVRWRTDSPSQSWVRFGTSAGSLTSSASDAVLTTEHQVRLTGLTPATRYWYSIGTEVGPLAGDASFTFRTAPAAGPTDVRLWAIGDSGEPSAAAFAVRDAYAAWTGSRGTDLWLMLGDNAYTTGTDSEYQTAVFNQYPVMLRQSVLWPTRGNHDVLHAGANNDYYDIFTMPAAGEAGGLPSGSEAYYAFNWADIHFICLDSEGSSRAPGSAMLTWLANDLAANTRKWVIAFWHHPPYTKGSHDSDNPVDSEGRMRDMRENALPILDAGGADLVLAGHSHSYERSFLLDGHYGLSGTLAPSMIVDGGDGRTGGDGAYVKDGSPPVSHEGAVYAVAGSSSKTSGGTLNHPVMVTSLNFSGSLVLDLQGDVLDARFLGTTGAVLDSFRILKPGTLDAPGGPGVARDMRLGPAMPNPFALDLRLGYTLASAGRVRLDVHDLAGRRVKRLAHGWQEAGRHEARWDGRDDRGGPLPGGVYVAVLEVDGKRVSRKISLVR